VAYELTITNREWLSVGDVLFVATPSHLDTISQHECNFFSRGAKASAALFPASVCLSVRHTQASSTYPTLYCSKIRSRPSPFYRTSQRKFEVASSSGLQKKIRYDTLPVAVKCCQLRSTTVAGLWHRASTFVYNTMGETQRVVRVSAAAEARFRQAVDSEIFCWHI